MSIQIPKLILPNDIREEIAMKEVAKILTETEGKTSPEKRDEIFQTFLSIDSLKSDMKGFFTKTNDPVGEIFAIAIEATGLTDILSVNHEKTRWIFAVSCARVPKQMYNTTSPENALREAGVATGIKLSQKYGFPVHFMYGDSRVYNGPSNTGNKNTNLAFIFGYKEQTSKYS